MDSPLPILPNVVCLASAVFAFVLRHRPVMQRTVSVAGAVALAVCAALLVASVSHRGVLRFWAGGWTPPYGIGIAADALSAMMIAGGSVVAICVVIYAMRDFEPRRLESGFYPLVFLLMAGVCGVFVSTDLFNLFVWFELLLVASFGLMALGSKRGQFEATLKYAGPGIVGSLLFLAGVGVMYGLTGTLNLADMPRRLSAESRTAGLAAGVLLLGGFGVKAAVFPMYFWLPASYHMPHGAVSALFAGLLTKVAVYAMLRTASLAFPGEVDAFRPVLGALAALTLATGVIGALSQRDVRRAFSFILIATVGFMLVGPAIWTGEALAGTSFYMLEDMFTITAVFLIADQLQRSAHSRTLEAMRNKIGFRPLLAIGFFLAAFSIASFPPLSGFWSKLVLARAGVAAGEYVLVGALMVAGLAVLLTVTRIWNVAFWSQKREPSDRRPMRATNAIPIGVLCAAPVLIGLFPARILGFATRAGAALVDPRPLIEAVLGL